MAKKRKTLPKDFDALLRKGDLKELKEVFDKCELDARGGYGKETALAFDHCPHELAQWLVEQGADLQAPNTYGATPLHSRSRSIFGNIQSLLASGADVNALDRSGDTSLHAAGNAHNVENTELLLAHGATPHTINNRGNTPLEEALMTCSNIDIEKMAKIAAIYRKAQVTVTPKMKEFVQKIGERFEFHRAGFAKDSVEEVSLALFELYRLFDVKPIAQRVAYDGKSPIIARAKNWEKQHQELWELLVPSSGAASTVQGEVIRISGRIHIELENNGGVNWDSDYKKMADALLAFLHEGNTLSSVQLNEAETLVKKIKHQSGQAERLCELAVNWVAANPSPITLSDVAYRR